VSSPSEVAYVVYVGPLTSINGTLSKFIVSQTLRDARCSVAQSRIADNTTDDVLRQDADIDQHGGSQVKSRLVRVIAAATAGLALTLGVAATPAQAAGIDEYSEVGVDILKSLLSKLEDGQISPAEAIELVQQLTGALAGVKVDVVSRLDAQLVAELKAYANTATTKAGFLNNPFYAAVYAYDVAKGANRAVEYIDVVSSDGDLDTVGRAMVILFTATAVAEEKVGTNAAQRRIGLAEYRAGLEKLVAKMAPRCSPTSPDGPAPVVWACTYDGRTAIAEDREIAEQRVMADTAEKVAKDALEELRLRNL
jgi:hypothetical protein